MLASGSQFTDLGAEQKSKLGAEFARGVWELASKGEPNAIAELHEFAKKKSLLRLVAILGERPMGACCGGFEF